MMFLLIIVAIYTASYAVFESFLKIKLGISEKYFGSFSSAIISGTSILLTVLMAFWKLRSDAENNELKDKKSVRPFFALNFSGYEEEKFKVQNVVFRTVSEKTAVIQDVFLYVHPQKVENAKWYKYNVGYLITNEEKPWSPKTPIKLASKEWEGYVDCIVIGKTSAGERSLFMYADGVEASHMIVDGTDPINEISEDQITFYGYNKPNSSNIINVLKSIENIDKLNAY